MGIALYLFTKTIVTLLLLTLHGDDTDTVLRRKATLPQVMDTHDIMMKYCQLASYPTRITMCINNELLWSVSIKNSFWKSIEWLEILGKSGIIVTAE